MKKKNNVGEGGKNIISMRFLPEEEKKRLLKGETYFLKD